MNDTPFIPRDFIETGDGLLFAVVGWGTEDGRIPAFLRYVREVGGLRKLATEEAADRVRANWPAYLFWSQLRDIDLHGVPPARVIKHYRPRACARSLASRSGDRPGRAAADALALLTSGGVGEDALGVTGSLLVGASSETSDVDLVVYDRDAFARAREIVRTAIATGQCGALDAAHWRDAFERRRCSLSLAEYVWHEARKHNKCVVEGIKVDISCVSLDGEVAVPWKKRGQATIRTTVIDDSAGFDYPARFLIDHPEVAEIVSYTNTFAGQAREGEIVLAHGWVEVSAGQGQRLVVGTSREAAGEFIKVVSDSP